MSFESTQPIRLVRGRSFSSRTLCAMLGIATLTLLSANAGADNTVSVDKIVRYADLNLSKEADAAALYARLKVASKGVCSDYSVRDLKEKHLRARCYSAALAAAVEHVNHPGITALHASDSQVRLARGSAAASPQT